MKKLNLHKVISLLLFLGAFAFVIMAFYWSIEQPSHRPIKAIEVGDLVKTPEGEYVIEYYMDRS